MNSQRESCLYFNWFKLFHTLIGMTSGKKQTINDFDCQMMILIREKSHRQKKRDCMRTLNCNQKFGCKLLIRLMICSRFHSTAQVIQCNQTLIQDFCLHTFFLVLRSIHSKREFYSHLYNIYTSAPRGLKNHIRCSRNRWISYKL